VPEFDEKTRQRIIKAGKKVLDARALHPERSLAEHYNPLAMAPELIKAHDALDREVDKVQLSRKQRQRLLMPRSTQSKNPPRFTQRHALSCRFAPCFHLL